MSFDFSVPTLDGPLNISISAGSSVVIVGANGGGKTRLAVHIENAMSDKAHRISAHRALALNPSVNKISEERALLGLRTGYANPQTGIQYREGHRWQSKAAISLLNDFDFLVQALFAEQSNTALETHTANRRGDTKLASATKFEKLSAIWDRLLPHRKLHFSGDDIQVTASGSSNRYAASDMSDGERAIFYIIGQALVAAPTSLLIVDEPELHVHRSIMSALWDELEACRPDCAFVFITHDLDFAASRMAQKFVIHSFSAEPRWEIEAVPKDTGFDEKITTLILGSRRPILFVEGTPGSLDQAIYRACYPEWTVVPRGSCANVIHSVRTMKHNNAFTRVDCAGLIDADGHTPDEILHLNGLGVAVLPVTEIESLMLLPSVSEAIARHEGFDGAELAQRLADLKNDIYKAASEPRAVADVVVRHCRRVIDRTLKMIDLSAAPTIPDMIAAFAKETGTLDITRISHDAEQRIRSAITADDLPKLLANFDNKGLLAHAATRLKKTSKAEFESWIVRVLSKDNAPLVLTAIKTHAPVVTAA